MTEFEIKNLYGSSHSALSKAEVLLHGSNDEGIVEYSLHHDLKEVVDLVDKICDEYRKKIC